MRQKKQWVGMLPRSTWIVLLLYSLGRENELNEPIIGSVRLMKGLFLMSQELRLQKLRPYRFVPYLYGPTSFEAYSDINGLIFQGAIYEQASAKRGWSRYALTYQGQTRAARLWKSLPEKDKEKIRKIKQKVNGYSFLELLRYVYQKYPKFAKSTVLPGLKKK